MKASEPPVIVEQALDAPIEKVWQAITDRETDDPVVLR